MEIQKGVSLLNNTGNEFWKFVTQKSYVINGQNNTEYDEQNVNDSATIFETKVTK